MKLTNSILLVSGLLINHQVIATPDCSDGSGAMNAHLLAEIYPDYKKLSELLDHKSANIESYADLGKVKKNLLYTQKQTHKYGEWLAKCASNKDKQFFVREVAAAEILGIEYLTKRSSRYATKQQINEWEKWNYIGQYSTPETGITGPTDFINLVDALVKNFDKQLPEIEQNIENKVHGQQQRIAGIREEQDRLNAEIQKEKARIKEEEALAKEIAAQEIELKKLKNTHGASSSTQTYSVGSNYSGGLTETLNPEHNGSVTQQQIRATYDLILAYGYRCDTMDHIVQHAWDGNFSVSCNNYKYTYKIEDKGGNWIVSLKD